jgi:uncharacterized SAM-binding protein YcdF (DUF218 family)
MVTRHRHRFLRRIFRLAWIGVGIFAVTVLTLLAWSTSAPRLVHAGDTPAEVIVVLGAGMSADGTLHPPTIARVRHGVALYDQGLAPRLHFTGGSARPGGPGAGDQMAALAQALGVPAQAVSTENTSHSTLQNALFSAPGLVGTRHIILVTEGWHLPRSWASFRWAGSQRISLAMSERFGGFRRAMTMIPREAAAIWFNAGRLLLWQAAGWTGVDREDRDGWLR